MKDLPKVETDKKEMRIINNGNNFSKIINCFFLFLIAFLSIAFVSDFVSAAITYDTNTSVAKATQVASYTWKHTVGVGSNKFLIVGVAYDEASSTKVSNVSFGSQAFTRLNGTTPGGGGGSIEVWYLLNPDSGAKFIKVNMSGATTPTAAGAVSYFGVDQSNPISASATSAATSTGAIVLVASATNKIVIDFLSKRSVEAPVVGAGQSQILRNFTAIGSDTWIASSKESGASTVNMSWSWGVSRRYGIVATSLNPATAVSVVIDYPTSTLYSTAVTQLNYTVTNSSANRAYCWYSLDSGATNSTPDSTCLDFTGLSSSKGSNTWRVYANDTLGNNGSASVTFEQDNASPTLVLDFPLNNTNHITNTIDFLGSITDGTSIKNVSLIINGTRIQTNSTTYSSMPTLGTYTGTTFTRPNPRDIVYYDDIFWITNIGNLEVFATWADNLTANTRGFNYSSGGGNGSPQGITVYNDSFWIVDDTDDELYKYYTNGTYTGTSFNYSAGGGNGLPTGITSYNDFFWITDTLDGEVYKYYTNGTYTGTSFDTVANPSGNPSGITSYNDFFWITDSANDQVYKYYTNGTYTGTSFNHSAGGGNGFPSGITAYKGKFWVADNTDSLSYQYQSGYIHYEFNDVSVSDGNNNWTLEAYDTGSNKGTTETRTFNVTADRTNPLISYSTLTKANNTKIGVDWIALNVSITEANRDTTTFRLFNSSGQANKTGYSAAINRINFTGLVDGTYQYNVTVSDLGGNINSTPTRYIYLDTTNPSVFLSSPANNTNHTTSTINFLGSVGDGGNGIILNVSLIINGTIVQTNSTEFDIPSLGTYTGTSFSPTAANTNIDSIAVYNDFLWVADPTNKEVYKYTASGTYTGTSFDTQSGGGSNSLPVGIEAYNDFLWIVDSTDNAVYKHWTNGTYTGTSFNSTGGNIDPNGITSYNDFFWITDTTTDNVYKYWTNGTYTGTFFNHSGPGGNRFPDEIRFYNNFFWIVDGVADKIYKYWTNGTYTGTFFNHSEGGGNAFADGMWVYNNFFWIADNTDDKFYQYRNGYANYTFNNIEIVSGNQNWTLEVYDSFGHRGTTGIWEFTSIDTTNPLISYSTLTKANNSATSNNWVALNVSITEANRDTTTFRLFNSSGQVNKTYYTTSVNRINFTGLADENYRYNVTVNDTVGHINSTSTRYITLSVETTCSCPTSGNWVISDGSSCLLDSACSISPNSVRVMSGTLKISNTGSLQANGCFVADGAKIFVQDGGKFLCKG